MESWVQEFVDLFYHSIKVNFSCLSDSNEKMEGFSNNITYRGSAEIVFDSFINDPIRFNLK